MAALLVAFDAFIAYSRRDATHAELLADRLKSLRYRVFLDRESIHIGEDWKQRIDRSIRQSRMLILCWSSEAKDSDYVRYEFMRALALKKPVLPWMLDNTPLPALIELQAVADATPEQAAIRLAGELGWTATRRKWLAASAAVLITAGGFAAAQVRRSSTYEFHGVVSDDRNLPLEGVTVTAGDASAQSDRRGRYVLRLPGETPQSLQLRFSKPGYQSESIVAVTGRVFEFGMKTAP